MSRDSADQGGFVWQSRRLWDWGSRHIDKAIPFRPFDLSWWMDDLPGWCIASAIIILCCPFILASDYIRLSAHAAEKKRQEEAKIILPSGKTSRMLRAEQIQATFDEDVHIAQMHDDPDSIEAMVAFAQKKRNEAMFRLMNDA